MEPQRIDVPTQLAEECVREYHECGSNNYFFWRWAFKTFPEMKNKKVTFIPDCINGLHFIVSDYENFIPPWAKNGVHLIPEHVMDELIMHLKEVAKEDATAVDRYRFWVRVYALMPHLDKTKLLSMNLSSRHALLKEEGPRRPLEPVMADFDSAELERLERKQEEGAAQIRRFLESNSGGHDGNVEDSISDENA
jgi:hypothetical protein